MTGLTGAVELRDQVPRAAGHRLPVPEEEAAEYDLQITVRWKC